MSRKLSSMSLPCARDIGLTYHGLSHFVNSYISIALRKILRLSVRYVWKDAPLFVHTATASQRLRALDFNGSVTKYYPHFPVKKELFITSWHIFCPFSLFCAVFPHWHDTIVALTLSPVTIMHIRSITRWWYNVARIWKLSGQINVNVHVWHTDNSEQCTLALYHVELIEAEVPANNGWRTHFISAVLCSI